MRSVPAALTTYDRAQQLRIAGDYEQALKLFRECLAPFPDDPANKSVLKALIGSIRCASGLEDWLEMEALALRMVDAFPTNAQGLLYLGEALIRQDRHAGAATILDQCLMLDPNHTEARALLNVARNADRKVEPRLRARPWPTDVSKFADLKRLANRYLLDDRQASLQIGPQTVFMTFGSCFAENLAHRLQTSGYRVNHEPIGEEVNSTFANRYLLEWVEKGAVNAPTAMMEGVYGPEMRERLLAAITESEVFILTIGVAPCFFDDKTGEFVFSLSKSSIARDFLVDSHTMRTTTVAENALNIRRIIDSIRRLSKREAKIVLTVSPVPLAGTTEFGSVIVADCISKSTLRVACHEVMTSRAGKRVRYWPSFEIVRWIGTHLGPEHPPVFGAEDAKSRHVSAWLVDVIIDLFLERHSAGEANANGPPIEAVP